MTERYRPRTMASGVIASVTELPESRVRVQAEVPASEVERRLAQAASSLGREMRVPGFRKGKVPAPVVIRRVGREAVLDEAVRNSLGSWYADAIDAAGISPVGDPSLDLGDLPPEGSPLTFSIEIGVRPAARLGDYKGLEVGRREPDAPDERVEEEIERQRERVARLQTVERAAEPGDFLVIDYAGSRDGEPFEGGEGRDQLVELGSGRLVPGFEEQLTGASAGEERAVEITFPDDYGAEELAGRPATFAVTVKEVKSKQLPELDDEFAAEAGYDSVEELREDVASRVREAEERAIEAEFREAVVDAVAAGATIELPDPLVEGRAREMWEHTLRSLAQQGITREAYAKISGKGEEEVIEEAKPDAARSLAREAVLAAVVEAEGIDATEDELLEALAHLAEHERTAPEKLLRKLRKAGREDELRADVETRKAIDLLASSAKPIPVARAQAREALWTPGQDEPGAGGGQLWTPGG